MTIADSAAPAGRHLPPREACVLRYVLERHAARDPGRIFAVFADGRRYTYGALHDAVRRAAAGFQRLGVRQGEHVLCWLPNDIDALVAWFALNYIGAVYVPVNLAYKGKLLEHAVALSDARLIVLHADLAPRLDGIAPAQLRTAVVVGRAADAVGGLAVVPASVLAEDGHDVAPLERPIEPWDTQSIIFTSGTTGPSKAVLSSYMHLYSLCGPSSWAWLRDDDRFMINLPLFHIGGTSCTYAMLLRGASIAVVDAFDTESFLPIVKATGTTAVGLMGVMAPFLMKRPPSPADRDHGLRIVVMIPLSGDVPAFAERFGVEVYTVFNMTEISTPCISARNPTRHGTCGQARPGVQIRLVDAHDREVPVGEVGEMVLRTDLPWAMNHGYYKNPEATAQAWRNGWFHTGDAFRVDAEGNYFFVDRMKDTIRRRGENVSSVEVEAELCAHPAIREAAAVAVPSEMSEDEILAVVAPVAGHVVDPMAVIDFLRERTAHFMIPRYIRIVDALPRTPTAKVQKHLLKADGITSDTFDREAHGIKVHRERIGTRSSPPRVPLSS